MRCRNCGQENGPNTRFCNNCGSPLGNAPYSGPTQNYPNNSGYNSNSGYPPQGYGTNQPGYNPNGQYAPKKSGGTPVAIIILVVIIAIGLIGALLFFFLMVGISSSQANLSEEIIGTWTPVYSANNIKLTFSNGSQVTMSQDGSTYGLDTEITATGTYTLVGDHLTMTFNRISAGGVVLDYDTIEANSNYNMPETFEADVRISDDDLKFTEERVVGTKGTELYNTVGVNAYELFTRSST